MKLSRKGYMLAEVTVAAALAVTVIVSMYASSTKMIIEYEKRENYNNIDTIYATSYIYNYLIDSNNINTLLTSYSSYIDIKTTLNNPYINTISTEYKLNKIILMKGNNLTTLSNSNINKSMKNYLNNYLNNNVNNNNFYLIVERIVDKNNYYYSIEL